MPSIWPIRVLGQCSKLQIIHSFAINIFDGFFYFIHDCKSWIWLIAAENYDYDSVPPQNWMNWIFFSAVQRSSEKNWVFHPSISLISFMRTQLSIDIRWWNSFCVAIPNSNRTVRCDFVDYHYYFPFIICPFGHIDHF